MRQLGGNLTGTGNFCEQNRELELPNRETFAANQGIKTPGAPGGAAKPSPTSVIQNDMVWEMPPGRRPTSKAKIHLIKYRANINCENEA